MTEEPKIATPQVSSNVESLLAAYTRAKKKHQSAFDRFKENMEFASGLQRPGQEQIDCEQYTVPLVLRNINQKVSALYARNPTAEWQRRERMDFQIWDEKIESLAPLIQKTQVGGLDMGDLALVQDYTRGEQFRALLDKVGKTLEILYQYQVDEHDPNFKLQLKQLVRRVCITGVGYVRIGFERSIMSILTSDGLGDRMVDRAKRAKLLMDQLIEDGVEDSDPRWEQVKSLMSTMGMDVEEQSEVTERLVFDFLPSTSVIPDEHCRCLKGFVGARKLFIEKRIPLEEARAFFERPDLTVSNKDSVSSSKGVNVEPGSENKEHDECKDITVIEVLDKTNKTSCFICQGCSDYLQSPEPLDPEVGGFWPVFALTFNDVECEPGTKTSIFPPSDVQLMKHAQKEWNRTREELRAHRKANAPTYITSKGWLTEDDKKNLMSAVPNSVLELQGIPPDGDVRKAIAVLEKAVIDPSLYNTDPYLQDILLAVGAQEANIGPANPNTTATGQTIAEQSRNVGLGSNVDDLDDFLSQLARAGGDIALQSFSQEVVKQIVGPGAVWPQENRGDFLNEIYLKIVAASSGRPNSALEIAKWERIAPLLMQMGANPMFIIRQSMKVYDDKLDLAEAFPLVPVGNPMQPPSGASSQQAPKQINGPGNVPQQQRPGPGNVTARQPLQQVASESPVPLAGM